MISTLIDASTGAHGDGNVRVGARTVVSAALRAQPPIYRSTQDTVWMMAQMRRSVPSRRRCRLSFCARYSQHPTACAWTTSTSAPAAIEPRVARLVTHGASGAPVRVQHRLIHDSQLTSSPDRIAVNVIPAIAAHTNRNAGHDDRIVGSLVGPDTLRDLPESSHGRSPRPGGHARVRGGYR